MAQRKFDDKRKQSNKKYMDKLTRISVWVTPEEKEKIQKDAAKEKKSVNGYIRNRLELKDNSIIKGSTSDKTEDKL